MEEQEKNIKHVTDGRDGPLDGVELEVNCVKTQFKNTGTTSKRIKKQSTHQGKILASYELGVVSVSIKDAGEMVSVRLDEMMFLLSEAAKASQSLRNKREKKMSEAKKNGK